MNIIPKADFVNYITQATFIKFLQRDHGFTFEEAKAENDLINSVGIERYRTVTRIGLRPINGRQQRNSIIQSYENAQNHASFDVEQR